MTTKDNLFSTQATGTNDWDTAENANWNIVERGAHVTLQAGIAINTGQVLAVNSGGFLFPFDINSQAARPKFFSYTAAASGDTLNVLRNGVVRSLGVTSNAVVGLPIFVDAKSPGIIVASYSGANRRLGIGMPGFGIIFDPQPDYFPGEAYTTVTTISAVVGSTHLFIVDHGLRGWNRRTLMQGSSNLVKLQFWSNSARTTLLYETFSGGVTTVGSFLDQAGWPYENTDASTYSGKMYGSFSVLSGSNVTTGDHGITIVSDREF